MRVSKSVSWPIPVRIALMTMLLLMLLAAANAADSAPGDLVLPRKSDTADDTSLPPSSFPHWVHRVHYRCDACHNRLFKMELGSSNITMDAMSEGQFCGACHNGDIAFATNFDSCNRCHVAPD